MSDSYNEQINCNKTNGLTINVGSRKSQLALIQTNTVIAKLTAHYKCNKSLLGDIDNRFGSGVEFKIIAMTTTGDRILDKALPDIGAKSLFTRDLEVALVEGKVDFIVHSLKDLPTTLPQGCVIGAVLTRDDPNDALVLSRSLQDKIDPMDLILKQQLDGQRKPEKLKVGTSSHRRIAMLRRCNPDLECIDIRGNLNTRLAKLDKDDGEYSAIILAKAGLDRMGWNGRESKLLNPETDVRLSDWNYAVGQGAIAVECREGDERIIDLLAPVADMKTTFEVVAERSLMRKLEGGCSVPLGVRSAWLSETLRIKGVVLSLDGQTAIEAQDEVHLAATTRSNSATPKTVNTTCIVVSRKAHGFESAYEKMLMCSLLGISVANKMIDLGCLKLMRDSR